MTSTQTAEEKEVSKLLDFLHKSASKGKLQEYLSCFFIDATFVGTDATEDWSFREFAKLCHERFKDGKGWTYIPLERRVSIDAEGKIAWFYERLSHKDYAQARGTGILKKRLGEWRIAEYVLSFPVPNELADSLAQQVRELQKKIQ